MANWQNKNRPTLTHTDLEGKLTEVVAQIAECRNQIEDRKLDFARKEEAYRRAKSAAYLTAEIGLKSNYGFDPKKSPTVDDKKMYMDEVCKKEREASKIAEALSFSLSEQLKALYAEEMAYQSLLKERQSDRQFTNTDAQYGRNASPATIPASPAPVRLPVPSNRLSNLNQDQFLKTGIVNKKVKDEEGEVDPYPTVKNLVTVSDPFQDEGEIGDFNDD